LSIILDDGNELSPTSDGLYETDSLVPILFATSDIVDGDNHEQPIETKPLKLSSSLKLRFSPRK
jgi:hypothetical protein